jgi:hypothetical protein
MAVGLHVITERILQPTRESFVPGGAFNSKRKTYFLYCSFLAAPLALNDDL